MLSQDALDFWGLTREPFGGGGYVPLPGHVRARQRLTAVARRGGLAALVAPYGGGKTTLLRDWLEALDKSRLLLVQPPALAAEKITVHGILSVILIAAAPSERVPSGVLRAALATRRALAERDRRALIIFEEAHELPRESLLACKRLLEIEGAPTVGVVLVGQGRLADRLGALPEVGQRTEMIRLSSLGRVLPEYLDARFRAAGRDKGTGVFDRAAFRLLSERCQTPLALNALVSTALEKAATAEIETISADLLHSIG